MRDAAAYGPKDLTEAYLRLRSLASRYCTCGTMPDAEPIRTVGST